MHHHSLRRTLPALAALGIAVVAPLATAGPAAAHVGNRCDTVEISYSIDGGAHFTKSDDLGGPAGKVVVKLDDEVARGCEYPVSLAAYETEGATWQTSGQQTLVGFATGLLTQQKPQLTLDLGGKLPKCFGQVDLYNGSEKYEGDKAPHYPHPVIGDEKIAWWNGGQACTPTPTPTPSPSTSTPAPTPTGSTPTPTPKPTPSPSASSSKPAAPASPSAPSTPVSTDVPSGKPEVKPVSSTPTSLASTGTDGSALATVAGAGAVLLGLGAGAVVLTRRRSAKR
ncbi:LPXTG cell wall anchor domain-containing protein [Kitasatospora sp. NPDC058965]|uniref:LPXTG cell wall anchor domain-containing protein n=1 Tax=Kitasatospora sp. NPDC058965 TaxID=3346682 RepID=UPI0036C9C2D7